MTFHRRTVIMGGCLDLVQSATERSDLRGVRIHKCTASVGDHLGLPQSILQRANLRRVLLHQRPP